MANKIAAILEQRDKLIKKSSFEVISAALKLAGDMNLELSSIIIGNEIENINEAGRYGINSITHFKNPALEKYSASAYSEIAVNYINSIDADYVILANTSFGNDLAPRIAAKLNAGCIMDCIELNIISGELIASRPVYAGKAVIDVKFNSRKRVITIRPNIFKAVPVNGNEINIEIKEPGTLDLKTKVVDYKKAEGMLDVAEANIIVSGGRGMKGPENFYLLENLANVLGAAVGASRAVVDAGWRPHREQVGQTGKTVSPSLYIACGISGAIQHLAGMSSAKYIVAINKDKDAPIFNIADYGITGDALEILPVLTDEIKKLKS